MKENPVMYAEHKTEGFQNDSRSLQMFATVERLINPSVPRYCKMSRVQEKKAPFNQCLTVLGPRKQRTRQYCKLLKAIWER